MWNWCIILQVATLLYSYSRAGQILVDSGPFHSQKLNICEEEEGRHGVEGGARVRFEPVPVT